MIELSNTAAKTVSAGDTITFDTVVMKSGNGECHRRGSGSVKLCAKGGIYQVYFSANVTGATEDVPVQLSMQLGGEPIPESTTVYTPATANAVGNISFTIPIRNNCCDYNRISVVNSGTSDVILSANPVLFVRRLA